MQLSLPTVSMIPQVTAVGLSANAGHGTGLAEPSFAGLIQSIDVYGNDGEIITIDANTHPDHFEAIRAAQLGLFGVVKSIVLRVEDEFMLKEERRVFADARALEKALPRYVGRQYFTLEGVPRTNASNDKPSIQVRTWKRYAVGEIEDTIARAPQDGGAGYNRATEQFKIELAERFLAMLVRCPKLMHAFFDLYIGQVANQLFDGLQVGEKSPLKAGHEYEITHSQSNFPRNLEDISFMFPVDQNELAEVLSGLVSYIETVLAYYGRRDIHPLTFTYYIRIFGGTDGGLSTSATEDDQCIISLDFLTTTGTHHFQSFMARVRHYIQNQIGVEPRYHLGKELPRGVDDRLSGMSRRNVRAFKAALVAFHGDEDAVVTSPYMTPYFAKILGYELGFDFPAPYASTAPRREDVFNEAGEVIQSVIKSLENAIAHDHYRDPTAAQAFISGARKLRGDIVGESESGLSSAYLRPDDFADESYSDSSSAIISGFVSSSSSAPSNLIVTTSDSESSSDSSSYLSSSSNTST